MNDRGRGEGLDGTLGDARIVPTEAVFDGATALATAVAGAVGDLAVGAEVRVAALLQRVDLVRRAAHQVERAVVTQAARQLRVHYRAAQVEPRIRMLNAATNARCEAAAIAETVATAIKSGRGKVPVDATLATIRDAIEELQKLARLIERAADDEGRATRC